MRIRTVCIIVVAAVILLAGAVITAFLYQPVRYNLHESRLKSPEKVIRDYAANQVGADGEKAIPYLKKWLKSDNELLVKGSCRALAEMNDKAWKQCLPELEKILSGEDSELTDHAAQAIARHDENWQEKYKDNPAIIRNIDTYTSWGIKDNDWHKRYRRYNRTKDEPEMPQLGPPEEKQ
ncbi:MAG: HEAT repeat domain-containing protein [Planctomycetota bacterium]|nr:MAG: HEAT repeat domain-containing protein [Planctomycetota bacterium]